MTYNVLVGRYLTESINQANGLTIFVSNTKMRKVSRRSDLQIFYEKSILNEKLQFLYGYRAAAARHTLAYDDLKKLYFV